MFQAIIQQGHRNISFLDTFSLFEQNLRWTQCLQRLHAAHFTIVRFTMFLIAGGLFLLQIQHGCSSSSSDQFSSRFSPASINILEGPAVVGDHGKSGFIFLPSASH